MSDLNRLRKLSASGLARSDLGRIEPLPLAWSGDRSRRVASLPHPPNEDLVLLRWARRAADAGEPGAMNFVGNFYRFRWGVPRDYAEAMPWYHRAAEHSGPFAAFGMSNAGDLYWNGWGVSEDHAEAVRWYYRAAQNCGSWGMNNLAWAIEHGDGIGKDVDTAVQWYRRAAALSSDPDQRDGAERAIRNLHRLGY